MQHTRTLNKQDYKTLSLAALGGALEFYDFIIFVFFSVIIGKLFFPADMPLWLQQVQTFGIFAAGYLARPFGGIIMAHFGDLFGRKRMFSLSILMMAVPTLCIGLLPTYENIGIFAPLLLLLMRVLQGAAVGGEVPGAWVFVSEHVPGNRVGLACGILTAGLTAGILLGSLVSTLINTTMADSLYTIGWRIPFFLGGIFGLFAMYLRRWLKETPIFNEMKEAKKLANEMPLKSVLSSHGHAVVISMLLTWILSAGIMVVILMAPTYLQTQFKIPAVTALQANSTAIVALSIGCVFYGRMIDAFGPTKVFIFGGLYAVASTLFFYHSVAAYPHLLFISYALAGFGIGLVGSFAFVMVNAFPPMVRFTGISFSFNMAYAIAGGLTPLMIITITEYTNNMAPGYYVASLFTLGVILGVYLRGTHWMAKKQAAAKPVQTSPLKPEMVESK